MEYVFKNTEYSSYKTERLALPFMAGLSVEKRQNIKPRIQ